MESLLHSRETSTPLVSSFSFFLSSASSAIIIIGSIGLRADIEPRTAHSISHTHTHIGLSLVLSETDAGVAVLWSSSFSLYILLGEEWAWFSSEIHIRWYRHKTSLTCLYMEGIVSISLFLFHSVAPTTMMNIIVNGNSSDDISTPFRFRLKIYKAIESNDSHQNRSPCT